MIPLGVLASARVVAGGGTSAVFITATSSATRATTLNYNNISLGAEASNRTIIVVTHARYRYPTSVTIAGVSATKVQSLLDGYADVAVWTAAVPTGTTGTITVVHGVNAPYAWGIGVYAAYGSLAYNTHATSGTTNSVTLTAPSNCLVIAGLSDINKTGGRLSTYGYNALTPGINDLIVSGDIAMPSAGSYTVNPTASSYSNYALLAVAFTLT